MPRENGAANKKKLSDYSAINNNTNKQERQRGREREKSKLIMISA